MLLVQDVAIIPVLAAIPLLAIASSGAAIDAEVNQAVAALENPVDWLMPLSVVGAFIAALLAGHYLVHPLLGYVARTGVREAFTATGLAMVVGAAFVTQQLGLSPALGGIYRRRAAHRQRVSP